MDENVKPIPKDYVTLRELSILLRRSYPTVLRYIKRKQILSYESGGEHRIKIEEVQRYNRDGNHPNWEK